MPIVYDPQNLFAKMLRGEIPYQLVHEDDYILSFHDIQPKAPVHILAIPKGAYVDAFDFHHRASADEIMGFYKGINDIIRLLKLENNGFRLISNAGIDGCQEIMHYHIHILGGKLTNL